MKTILAIALVAALLTLPASAQIWLMSPTGGSPPTGAGGHGGGVVPNALLVNTGLPMFSIGTTPILVQ